MKKILIVNNNMKVGGVQKSLYNLLWALDARGGYDVTLLLFSKTGAYLEALPKGIHVVECGGPFRYLGRSQGEYASRRKDALVRGFYAAVARLCGRRAAIRLMGLTQPKWNGHYDCAVSFLHNGRRKAFYGGTQDYVLDWVSADRKVAFLHGDYGRCGANHPANNRMMARFDAIAACSDGCRQSFVTALPQLADRCFTVRNCHRYDELARLAATDAPTYDADAVHAVLVARLTHEKGVDRAITAVAEANARGVAVHLHVVGDGPLRGELAQQAAHLGVDAAVHFYGEQTNPYRYVQPADFLLVSSYHEAAPMVIDEALSLGVPVLTTATTSSEEMVTARHGGWVCENTQTSLTDTLIRVASDPMQLAAVRSSLTQGGDNRTALEQLDRICG